MDDFWTSNPDEEPDWFVSEDDGNTAANDDDAAGNEEAESSTHHALILLDASLSENRLGASLKAIVTVVRQQIRRATMGGAKRNGIGVMLYNTKYRWSADENKEKQKKDSSIHLNRSLDQSMEEEVDDDDLDEEEALFLQGTLPHWTNLHTLIDLEPPGVHTVQSLQHFTAEHLGTYHPDTGPPSEGDASVPSLPPLLLALRAARDIYAQAKCVKKTRKNATSKPGDLPDAQEIWIHTDQVDPLIMKSDNEAQRDEMKRLLQEAVVDLRDQSIQMHLWAPPDSDSTLYSSLVTTSEVRSAEEWIQRMAIFYKQVRPIYRVPLLWPHLNKANTMILDVYRLYSALRDPKVVPIHNTTGKILGKVQQLLTLDDGGGHVVAERRSFDPKTKPVSSSSRQRRQLRTFLEFGSDLIPFSLQEKVQIKRQCNIHPEGASLMILGFKPSSAIPFYHCIDHSYFAYPSATMSEKHAGGNAVAHLHASMLRQDVVAIGELLTRVTATSRLVALRPVPEELRPTTDDAWILIQAPGFLLTTLPFEEELRTTAVNVADSIEPSEALIQATMQLVEKQSFVDAVEIGLDFVNAPMDRFWNYIEQVAYGENEKASEARYDTEVDEEQVLEHVGDLVQAVISNLPEDQVATTEGSSRKRKVAAPPPADESGLDWLRMVQEGTLSECKVPDLKAKLRSLGESTSGNKSVLMQRLEKFFASFSGVATANSDVPELNVKIKKEDDDGTFHL